MKNFITTIGSLLLLFVFLMQFVANQNTYTRVLGAECAVRKFCAASEAKGEITEDMVQTLKTKVSSALKCRVEEVDVKLELLAEYNKVHMTGTDDETSNNGSAGTDGDAEATLNEVRVIQYEIGLPLKEIVGGARILGLSDEENSASGICKGVIHLIGGGDT